MNNKIERVPTYGSVVTSLQYDAKIRRHDWFLKHKKKLYCVAAAAVVTAVAVALVLFMI